MSIEPSIEQGIKEVSEGREVEVREGQAYTIPDETKVLIGTPNYTNTLPSEAFRMHVECCEKWTKWGIDYSWMMVGRTFVHFARSQVCQAAIDGGFTHIFWVDDDAVVDPEILPKFIQHNKDVVIAPYPMRRSPFQCGILSATHFICDACETEYEQTGPHDRPLNPDEYECPSCGDKGVRREFHDHKSYYNLMSENLNQGLVSVDGGGTHAMLIKVDTLTKCRGHAPPAPGEKLSKDNHSYPKQMIDIYDTLTENLDEESREVVNHYIGDLPDQSMTFDEDDKDGRPMFMMPKTGTEDMFWCYRALCKGVKIWADTDVWADHIGFAPVITRDWMEQAEKNRTTRLGGDNRVQLMRTGERGRDHTSLDASKSANLV